MMFTITGHGSARLSSQERNSRLPLIQCAHVSILILTSMLNSCVVVVQNGFRTKHNNVNVVWIQVCTERHFIRYRFLYEM